MSAPALPDGVPAPGGLADQLDEAFALAGASRPAGEARLLDALDRIVAEARAINRSNRGHANRADRTGRHLDSRRHRDVAAAAFTLGSRVERLRNAVRAGEFR